MRRRKIHDVTVPIRPSMPVWPGDPGFERSSYRSIEEGASSEVSVVTMGSHIGTHVDAPAHFLSEASTVDELPLDVLVGEAIVFELGVEDQIRRADLETLEFAGRVRVLFKTRNSSLWESDEFVPDFVSFAPGAAEYLVEAGVKLVGIDYLSVGSYDGGEQVHHIFLENDVVVIEGLNLSEIEPGSYEIVCLPLKILGADGAPARVLLLGE